MKNVIGSNSQLVADEGGIARKECRQCRCSGELSGLRFTDIFVVHLPWWRFRVTAEGYQPSEWFDLDVPEYIRHVQRAGPGKATLVIRVALERIPS